MNDLAYIPKGKHKLLQAVHGAEALQELCRGYSACQYTLGFHYIYDLLVRLGYEGLFMCSYMVVCFAVLYVE